jgi:flavin-dependent dehydrogenase
MEIDKTDVLVIGGGPAGTTFAALMIERGWDVTLVEKDEHPRFHIGESLLPMNLPIFERLGVMDEIEAIGIKKLGADFTVGNSQSEQKTFYFDTALGDSPDHAFEVTRSEFDQILFENCKRSGVHTHERMRVQHVEAMARGNHKVVAKDADNKNHAWETRFVVDASGRDTFYASAEGWKKRNTKHASAAVYGHYRNVERRPGKDDGNISLYWFDHGWIWMIPLQNDVMSIGAVCYPEYIKTRRGSLGEFLLDTLNGCAEIRERMVNAEVVRPACATGNYSYLTRRMTGPGYLLVGDSFAFIDPVFSSGVYLAMNGAERAVDVAQAWLDGSRFKYFRECRRFRRETQKGLSAFSWFIYRFTSPVMSDLMSNPRNDWQVVQAVVSMLAGDVYADRSVRRRLLIFKGIYLISTIIHWRKTLAARKRRKRSIRTAIQEDG